MTKSLAGKVALVTGASSGLGEAAALAFAREGAKVVLAARREDRCLAIVRKIEAEGGEAFFIKTDVTKSQDIEAMVAGTTQHFGRLDCAVNNAGIGGPALTPLAEIAEADWDAVMNVNLKAVWLCMKHEIPAMLKHGGGAIVNVSSIYGHKGMEFGATPYTTSKFGVVALSRSAAIDYAQQGIRVNAVAPGFAHSELVDPYVEAAPELMKTLVDRHSAMKRLGNGDEIADAIVWLCSDGARFVNGTLLPIDGGETSRLY